MLGKGRQIKDSATRKDSAGESCGEAKEADKLKNDLCSTNKNEHMSYNSSKNGMALILPLPWHRKMPVNPDGIRLCENGRGTGKGKRAKLKRKSLRPKKTKKALIFQGFSLVGLVGLELRIKNLVSLAPSSIKLKSLEAKISHSWEFFGAYNRYDR